MQLTTTQVSLIAAAPAITYRATARLGRDRRVRQRRAETYIEALAVLGRLAAYVAEPAARPNPFEAIAGDQWQDRDKEALETHRARLRVLYADLISLVREELKQDRDPWWRRTRRSA